MNIIEAHNVTRSFTEGGLVTDVLKGITLSVAPGEFVAIMGKSGAGKSTLMYQLSVLDHPTDGYVTLDGVDVAKLSEREQTQFRLNTLGYIFQDYALVPDLSARENIMVPLLMRNMTWSDAKQIADTSLAEVGLAGKNESLPAQLSGGEQQRVSIARAIAGKPKIIFADEPTANLDSISGNSIIDLLGALNKNGQTIVMVTHENDYIKYCNRIIEIADGKIVGEKRI